MYYFIKHKKTKKPPSTISVSGGSLCLIKPKEIFRTCYLLLSNIQALFQIFINITDRCEIKVLNEELQYVGFDK